MQQTKELDYVYAVSRIRAKEKKLLNENQFFRMLEAKSLEETIKILEESEYGDVSTESLNISDYEKILIEEHKKVYHLMGEIAPKTKLVDLFLQMNDYHNIKIMIKAEFSGKEHYELLLKEYATIPVNKLKAMLKDRKFSEMNSTMRSAVEESIDTFNRTADPQVIDIILDKASFKQMKELSDQIQNSFLSGLVKILIDVVNIKIFMRVRKIGKAQDFLKRNLIDSGRIDQRVYLESLDAPLDHFEEAVRFSHVGFLVEEGIAAFNASESLTRMEILSDNFVMAYIKKAKYITFGMEPLIGYILAKENEIKNVRIILTGKTNNIPNEIIRERLRESYV